MYIYIQVPNLQVINVESKHWGNLAAWYVPDLLNVIYLRPKKVGQQLTVTYFAYVVQDRAPLLSLFCICIVRNIPE